MGINAFANITPAPLAVGVSLQGVGGKSLAFVTLGHDKFARADAFRFLDEQDAAEKIRLHVEPIKAAHVA